MLGRQRRKVPIEASDRPHTVDERAAIIAALYELDGPDDIDPAHHAFAVASGLVSVTPPYTPSPWPRHRRDG